MNLSMNALYQQAGTSKQAFSQQQKRLEEFEQRLSNLIIEADILRSEHPGCGVEKMYFVLKPDWLGRDRFVDVFMDLGYRIRKIRNHVRTTIPVSSKYLNLIEGMIVMDKNQIWQTDITYYRIKEQYYYLVFILDVYTKQIIGFSVSDHLRAEANIKALNMAINNCESQTNNIIHHSDRGSQYIANSYLGILNAHGFHISMGNRAQDNAYAERVNGTIKNEYLKKWDPCNFTSLKRLTKKAVNNYNCKRPHDSLPKRMSPNDFSKNLVYLSDQNRPKVIIYAEGNYEIKAASSRPDFRPKIEPRALICPIKLN